MQLRSQLLLRRSLVESAFRLLHRAAPSPPYLSCCLTLLGGPLAMLTYCLILGHPKAAMGHPEHSALNFCQKLCWPMLSTKLQMTRYSPSITSPLTSTGSLGAPSPIWIKIAGWKSPPFTSCSTRSPYFLGASFEAIHFIVSTRSLER
jgi:hypothetical protein